MVKTSKNTQQFSIRMDRELYERLDQVSKSSGLSKTFLIEKGTSLVLDEYAQEQELLRKLREDKGRENKSDHKNC